VAALHKTILRGAVTQMEQSLRDGGRPPELRFNTIPRVSSVSIGMPDIGKRVPAANAAPFLRRVRKEQFSRLGYPN
jgi:hypothetical protein